MGSGTGTALIVSLLLSMFGGGQAQPVLRISQVPPGTPPTDTLFVAGSFNGWNPHDARFALRRNADGTYRLPAASS